MFEKLEALKGLHPGIFLEYELKKKKLSKRQFAITLSEHPQTIGTITKGKRNMNTALSLKVEQLLGLEEGFLMSLQVFYDIQIEKKKLKSNKAPNLDLIRPVLFWDTKIENIDWELHKEFVIERVLKEETTKKNKK